MTGGVVYVRQNPDWGLDEAAVRRRLSKAAKVSLDRLDEETDVVTVTQLLTSYQAALRASGQEAAADGLQPLIEEPAEHFLAINPVTQQADPNISTE
jgi:glutamate synthase (NADPH/NADH) large chain